MKFEHPAKTLCVSNEKKTSQINIEIEKSKQNLCSLERERKNCMEEQKKLKNGSELWLVLQKRIELNEEHILLEQELIDLNKRSIESIDACVWIQDQAGGVCSDGQSELLKKTKKDTKRFACKNVERYWIKKNRPFFNVYPKVSEALLKTNLNIVPKSIPKNIIHELGVIRIKLPINYNFGLLRGLQGLYLVTEREIFQSSEYTHLSVYAYGLERDSFDSYWFEIARCPVDQFFDQNENFYPENTDDRLKAISRLCLGVLLLASDPEFIEPLLLSKDRGKKDPDGKLHEKAKRKGVFGFEIGRDFDHSPHVRRPHFAIRWTGKNGKTPKLVPVKGCVVNRKKLTEIPTGYEGDE